MKRVINECWSCGVTVYEGDEGIIYRGATFCSRDCLNHGCKVVGEQVDESKVLEGTIFLRDEA